MKKRNKKERFLGESNRAQVFLFWFMAFFGIASLVLGYLTDEDFAKALSDLGKIASALYVSFEITRYFSEISAKISTKKELGKLGESSGKRIFRLSEKIKGLADEIAEHPDTVSPQSTASRLRDYARDAEMSFEDIKLMADLDISITDLAIRPSGTMA